MEASLADRLAFDNSGGRRADGPGRKPVTFTTSPIRARQRGFSEAVVPDWLFPMMRLMLLGLCLLIARVQAGSISTVPDEPFFQDVSVKVRLHPSLAGATWRKLLVDRDGVAWVLTDRGLARTFGDELAIDHSFRPLANLKPLDIALSPEGEVFYLLADRWLSNGQNGRPKGHLPAGMFDRLAIGADGLVWLSGPGGVARASGTDGQFTWVQQGGHAESATGLFPIGSHSGVPAAYLVRDGRSQKFPAQAKDATLPGAWTNVTTLAEVNGQWAAGTTHGIATAAGMLNRLPATNITRIVPVNGGRWVGSTQGAFFESDGSSSRWATPEAGPSAPAPRFRFYASKRWLADDHVVDLAIDRDGSAWILTKTGLQKIEYRRWTLADKAGWFQRKVRSRHIRYGLSAERHLPVSGDVATSEMVDTDNDGGWSCYWLASQAFRYAATHDPEARAWAWETFGALERFQLMHNYTGFPARTIERTGFKYSDADQWHPATDPDWEWKSHTSSDEIIAHFFAYAILWECAANTPAEKERIRNVVVRIADHMLEHNLYLVDTDGKPTLWGRWNPEYVNQFPPTVYDRRLNSAEFTAMMQFAFHVTGDRKYKAKALELFRTAGYLENIGLTVKHLTATPGAVHQGIEMGDVWNHSDDELGFVTYWVLCRFAFDDTLRAKYLASVVDHWEMERGERYPFWNFVAGGCGLKQCAPAEAVWTLRGCPLDTISWSVRNSGRNDLTRLPKNFRGQETVELLPPGERQYVRCNTQPFILDAGGDGHVEFAGDEYLMGYWMGRFIGAIGAPTPRGGEGKR